MNRSNPCFCCSCAVIKSQGKGYSKCHSADGQLKLGRPLHPCTILSLRLTFWGTVIPPSSVFFLCSATLKVVTAANIVLYKHPRSLTIKSIKCITVPSLSFPWHHFSQMTWALITSEVTCLSPAVNQKMNNSNVCSGWLQQLIVSQWQAEIYSKDSRYNPQLGSH